MMESKVLIAYSGKYGSTKEVAEKIASYIPSSEVSHVSEVKNLDNFSEVIVGGPIYFDRWSKESVVFVQNNKEILKNKKVFYFFTCMTLSTKTTSSTKAAENYKKEIFATIPEVKPLEVKGFAGAVNSKKIPFYLLIPLKIILKIKGAKIGDYRDWDEIKQWAENL